eukprot:12823868-Alexandrium_andersonii.AAC.1
MLDVTSPTLVPAWVVKPLKSKASDEASLAPTLVCTREVIDVPPTTVGHIEVLAFKLSVHVLSPNPEKPPAKENT